MSFDVNVGRSQPVIKAAANMNNDGGSGGNTGYMMGGRRKKDNNPFGSVFANDDEIDVFELSSKLPKTPELPKESGGWLQGLINKIKK
jgi:hypothetical protein